MCPFRTSAIMAYSWCCFHARLYCLRGMFLTTKFYCFGNVFLTTKRRGIGCLIKLRCHSFLTFSFLAFSRMQLTESPTSIQDQQIVSNQKRIYNITLLYLKLKKKIYIYFKAYEIEISQRIP